MNKEVKEIIEQDNVTLEIITYATYNDARVEITDLLSCLFKENKKLHEENERLKQKAETEHKAYIGTVQELTETATRIDKALHRIQLLQMDGEVFIKDLGLIVRDLKGSDK